MLTKAEFDTEQLSICPGCGFKLLDRDSGNFGSGPSLNDTASLEPTADRSRPTAGSSPACQQLFHELCVYSLSLGDPEFIHQYVVDAYMAQHWRKGDKPIGLTFALVGLYLACELEFSGRQVQVAHMLLVETPKRWPEFPARMSVAGVSAKNVLEHREGEERNRAIRQWAEAVWLSWYPAREQIVTLVRERLPTAQSTGSAYF